MCSSLWKIAGLNYIPFDIESRYRRSVFHGMPGGAGNKLSGFAVMLTRRQFTIGCAATLSGGIAVGLQGRSETAPFSNQLPLPRLIEAAKHGNVIRLKAAPGRHAFVTGKPTRTYGYSAPVLGPVLRVRRGAEVEMVVENALDVDTTVHWHGTLVPGPSDGGPHWPIKPGATWRTVLKIDQPASTCWYHPHPHHDTARQVYMGLAGMIIVDDDTHATLGLPGTFGINDIPIILQDRALASDGSLGYDIGPLDVVYGGRGGTIIVNGAISPTVKVPRGLVRLRILNGANAQNFELRFHDQRSFHVIASDGGFLSAPISVSRLRIAPAERFEVLVDFSDGRPVVLETGPDEVMGVFGAVTESGPSDYAAIMRFGPGAGPVVAELPKRLGEPPAADPARAVQRRRFVLDNGVCGRRPAGEEAMDMPALVGINGRTHDMSRIDAETRLGTTEIWEIVSVGMAHPFHVHGAQFRILTIDGGPPPPHLTGWKDVVLVEDKAELLVAFNRPATREFPFMYHCHIMEHEDAGMMGQYICT
jgi:blue copper oxidase